VKVLYERCAGLDVHKVTVVACVRLMLGRQVTYETRTFETTTRGLLALSDWLTEQGCTHAVMESTGVFWKPVWHLLESNVELLLANAGHVKNVPGRKTDVNDAQWLADLLAHGLVQASFVPPTPIQELRDLTRTRKQLVRERVQHEQRLEKVLEDANVKLSSVISELLGMSGKAILRALAKGETDPAKLVELASFRLAATREELEESLRGRVTAHHSFLIGQHLKMVDDLDKMLEAFDARLETALKPFQAVRERLMAIPGISKISAAAIIAEVGVDMTKFPDHEHFISWAGLCPKNDVSAGKFRSTRLRKGAPWLKTTLLSCAWAAARTKGTYLNAQFHRLKPRRGAKKAACAVAASIMTAVYHMIRDGLEYKDLGPEHFVRHDKARIVNRLTRRIRELGYEVEIRQAAA
jgi:transposase